MPPDFLLSRRLGWNARKTTFMTLSKGDEGRNVKTASFVSRLPRNTRKPEGNDEAVAESLNDHQLTWSMEAPVSRTLSSMVTGPSRPCFACAAISNEGFHTQKPNSVIFKSEVLPLAIIEWMECVDTISASFL